TELEAHAVDAATMKGTGDTAQLHEVAHRKLLDPSATAADIERPGLGKPAEIGEKVEGIDPRGNAKPDVGNQITSIHQLAQPAAEAPSPEQLAELARDDH